MIISLKPLPTDITEKGNFTVELRNIGFLPE